MLPFLLTHILLSISSSLELFTPEKNIEMERISEMTISPSSNVWYYQLSQFRVSCFCCNCRKLLIQPNASILLRIHKFISSSSPMKTVLYHSTKLWVTMDRMTSHGPLMRIYFHFLLMKIPLLLSFTIEKKIPSPQRIPSLFPLIALDGHPLDPIFFLQQKFIHPPLLKKLSP